MRTLRDVCRSMQYPFSRPTTRPKVGVILLALVVAAVALLGLFVVVALTSLVIWGLPNPMAQYEIDAEWGYIQSDYRYPPPLQWTPDGSAIYISGKSAREGSTYVVSSDGTVFKELEHVVRPDVSTDGLMIVYSTWKDTGEFSYDIETAKLDGSDRQRLTEDRDYVDIAPVWSPDGAWIAFARVTHPSQRLETGTDKSGIYVMASDGSGLRRLYRLREYLRVDGTDESIGTYETFGSGPLWSPDGETLAFSIHKVFAVGLGEDRKVLFTDVLYTIGADGSNLVAVYEDGGLVGEEGSGESSVQSVAWSPNGDRLAFHDFESPYIINSDGTGLRKTADVIQVSSVSWSPDGTKLLFIGRAVGGIGVFVADADGGNYTGVGGYELRGASGAAWSPDGSRIAILKYGEYDDTLPKPYLQTMAPDGSDVQVLVERHESFGELKAVNSGWEWPWQR